MNSNEQKRKPSAFDESGIKASVAGLVAEIQSLYLSDEIPWVVGYSGGKDSTAVLQLVWMAIVDLGAKAHKPVHVISTDTLVENPVVATWVAKSLEKMREFATKQGLPLQAHRLTPKVADTFWVNLIGKGYPAPRPKFRWCTERLKIRPANNFIQTVVRENGEAILVLGTRKAESQVRASVMKRLEAKRLRDRLSPNESLPNSLVFSPIEEWSNDDVWLFLMQYPNPWGYSNKDLLNMYQGANPDGECPLVVDTTTPSCGDSRFGCWVCTLVEKDKSMQAMIQNDEEKQWMLPLLELRNELDVSDDRHLRDFRRLTGHVQMFHDRNVPGPYKQEVRELWLRKVLRAQKWTRENGPEYIRDIELISLPELIEIRRIWIVEKHELEDLLPGIYEEEVGVRFPGPALNDRNTFSKGDLDLLRKLSGGNDLHYQLARELLHIGEQHRSSTRRNKLFSALESAFKRSFYVDESDAIELARNRRNVLNAMDSDDRSSAIDQLSLDLVFEREEAAP